MADDPDFQPERFLQSLTQRPGVYRMLGEQQQVLYVGKAKNLRKRVSSYFRKNLDSPKTKLLVSKIRDVEVSVTETETEALLLEQQLIKELKPPYNILLRDDKSYPYIFFSTKDEFPRVTIHRGARKRQGQYLGPYPAVSSVRETINIVEKVFRIRTCEDSYFKNRSRPCLQYQIKRCTAPCVAKVSAEDYQQQVQHALQFLTGKDETVMQELVSSMQQAAEAMDFEKAAFYRDQISAIREIQQQQNVTRAAGNQDIFAVALKPGGACIVVMMVRYGRVLGHRSFYPKHFGELDLKAVLGEFLPQYYLRNNHQDLPDRIVLAANFEGSDVLLSALQQTRAKKLTIVIPDRGDSLAWLRMATTNAVEALHNHLASKQSSLARFSAFQEAFALEELPQRLECFDISHTQGEATRASCVVFDREGPLKAQYRRFEIKGIEPGDDYAAIRQVISRRYSRLKQEGAVIPDVVLVDGGVGQLNQAYEILQELNLTQVLLLGVSKGPGRKAGMELIHQPGVAQPRTLPSDSPALHLIQHIRDEAHRFAIAGHRHARQQARKQSKLEGIEGVGPKRRKALLTHFGGIQEVVKASTADLAKAPGISQSLAEEIYQHLHQS